MIFRAQQSHNSPRTQEKLLVRNTKTSHEESRSCVRYLKRLKMHTNILPFGRKTYSCFQQVQLRKKYITETTNLMDDWTNNSPLKDIAFKVIHIMSSLLQKSSKASKVKDYLKALERRIDLWSNGKIDEFLFESETIKSLLHHIKNVPMSLKKYALKSSLLTQSKMNTTRSVFGLQTHSPWQKSRITTNRSTWGSATNCRNRSNKVVKEDIKKVAGWLQLCTGQEAECEAALHVIHRVFESSKTEAIPIVDVENAFNSINWKALLHNIEYLCSIIAMLLCNCYSISARLFIIGVNELKFLEWTAKGNPTAMAAYTLGWTSLLNHLQLVKRSVKHVAFADDLSGAVKLEKIKFWWDTLAAEGQKSGYYSKASISFLIVKQHYREYAERIFVVSNIKTAREEAINLGTVLRDISFIEEYL